MNPSFYTIYHAFNMRYKTIGDLASDVAALGFTHIQFPPVQPTRTLVERDGELIRAQVKKCREQLRSFSELCAAASEKKRRYTGFQFDYFLRQRVYYTNMPTLRLLHVLLLEGVSYDDLLASLGSAKTLSPIAVAICEASISGKRHPYYALKEAADLLLQGADAEDTRADIETLTHLITDAKEAIRATKATKATKAQTTFSRNDLAAFQSEKREYVRQCGLLRDLNQRYALFARMEETSKLRSTLRSTPCTFATTVPITESILNQILATELMTYMPWWMIYQPMKIAIGDTFLGSVDEQLTAIKACKAAGLQVIVDVVVNNLAATAGEQSTWSVYNPKLHGCPSTSESGRGLTLADIAGRDDPSIKRLTPLLQGAFGSDDLTLVKPPFECRSGQEPTTCWMSQALPQLNQSHPLVQAAQRTFLESLRDGGVDGIRIDAAAHLTPADCARMIDGFSGLSYIEYVGGDDSWRKYPSAQYEGALRLEDFSIGEDLYTKVFAPHANLSRAVNFGGERLRRVDDLDSVVMVANHDQVMGSLPSRIYSELPSQDTVGLSLAYLIQRIYGNVLLMPHDVTLESVRSALRLRRLMKAAHIVREYVDVRDDSITSYKYDDKDALRFVVTLNLHEPLSFAWTGDPSALSVLYNSTQTQWMPRCFTHSRPAKRRTRRSGRRGAQQLAVENESDDGSSSRPDGP